jgi:hypothetical protein
MAKKSADKAIPKPKKSVSDEIDEFKSTSEIGNRVYEEWEGRVVLKKKGKDANGKDTFDKKFEPLICKRKSVKITEAEAAALNYSAQESPRMDYVIAYLPAGEGKTGEKVVLVEEEDQEGED